MLDDIRAEVAEWPGAAIARVEKGRKHAKVVLRFGGRERFVVVSSSPSDAYRGDKNKLRDVRHTLSELGAHRTERPRAAMKRARNKPEREALARVGKAPAKADPWAALQDIQFNQAEPREGHLRGALRLLAGSVRRMVARWRQPRAQGPGHD